MGFCVKNVEVSAYADIDIENEDIIRGLSKVEAEKVIIGLIIKYPILIKSIMADSGIKERLREEAIKEQQKNNKNLCNFGKIVKKHKRKISGFKNLSENT